MGELSAQLTENQSGCCERLRADAVCLQIEIAVMIGESVEKTYNPNYRQLTFKFQHNQYKKYLHLTYQYFYCPCY
jgi:hypothetical protein